MRFMTCVLVTLLLVACEGATPTLAPTRTATPTLVPPSTPAAALETNGALCRTWADGLANVPVEWSVYPTLDDDGVLTMSGSITNGQSIHDVLSPIGTLHVPAFSVIEQGDGRAWLIYPHYLVGRTSSTGERLDADVYSVAGHEFNVVTTLPDAIRDEVIDVSIWPKDWTLDRMQGMDTSPILSCFLGKGRGFEVLRDELLDAQRAYEEWKRLPDTGTATPMLVAPDDSTPPQALVSDATARCLNDRFDNYDEVVARMYSHPNAPDSILAGDLMYGCFTDAEAARLYPELAALYPPSVQRCAEDAMGWEAFVEDARRASEDLNRPLHDAWVQCFSGNL